MWRCYCPVIQVKLEITRLLWWDLCAALSLAVDEVLAAAMSEEHILQFTLFLLVTSQSSSSNAASSESLHLQA